MLVYLQMIETPEDKTKFEKLYDAYRSVMYHVAAEIVKNEYEAEDVVHNAFVSIAENIQKIDDPMSKKSRAYVITITENKAIDDYRRRRHHTEVPFDEESVGIQIDETMRHMVVFCFSRLPGRYRNVLSLKYWHGFDNREIGRMMHLSEANTAKLIQRAKAKLELLCKEEGIR